MSTAVRNPLIASQLFNVPLLVLPSKLDAVIYGIQERIGVQIDNVPEPSAFLSKEGDVVREGGYRIIDGVAVIEVFGALAHRGGYQADSTYILGYETVARHFHAALNNPEVHTILFVFDTPGGEVAGVFDLSNLIYQSLGKKRIVGFVSDMACSAGQLMAAACSEVRASITACTGSVGVVMRHIDQSKMIKDMGVKITSIFVGDHKVDGNPFEPLPENVRARYEDICMKLYNLFTGRIALYRNMELQAVVDTQAQVYIGDEGLDVGLVDGIETLDETLERLISERGVAPKSLTSMENKSMSETTVTAEPAATSVAAAIDEPPKKKVESAPAPAADESPTVDAGVAMQQRIQSIIGSNEGKSNPDLASHLAFKTSMSADDAKLALLAAGAGDKPAADVLGDAMAGVNQPDLGVEGGAAEMNDADRICASYAMATGTENVNSKIGGGS